MGIDIVEPVPSLFTFNMPDEPIQDLMGIVVEDAGVRIQGQKSKPMDPFCLHWGMSGPAVLKASSIGARWMHENQYQFKISVHWTQSMPDESLRLAIKAISDEHNSKLVKNYRPAGLPIRLWHYLLDKIDIPTAFRWKDIDQKWTNKLIGVLNK